MDSIEAFHFVKLLGRYCTGCPSAPAETVSAARSKRGSMRALYSNAPQVNSLRAKDVFLDYRGLLQRSEMTCCGDVF